MAHYQLRARRAHNNYDVLGPTQGRLSPAPHGSSGLLFFWPNLEPMPFTSVAAWRQWFERQGHTVEVVS